jgi:uncharacterized protein YbjT (DUF2867 family)
MILITGSTGVVGSAVIRELLTRDNTKKIRAMIRSEKDRSRLPQGVDPVIADFSNPPSLTKALEGTDAAFLVCAPVPDLIQLETNFLQACQQAKLPHLVYNSALGAADFPKTFPSWHRKVEDKARELKLAFAAIRPNGFMQNIANYFGPTIKSQSAFYGTIGDSKISLIDVRDVAAAIASALLDKSTAGKIYELSGPEAVSYPELAARLSSVLGKPIKYVNLTRDQMIQAMVGSGMPQPAASAVVDLDDYYKTGKGAASDRELRQLINGEPRKLSDYLKEFATQLGGAQ